jgi:hypothetical protein
MIEKLIKWACLTHQANPVFPFRLFGRFRLGDLFKWLKIVILIQSVIIIKLTDWSVHSHRTGRALICLNRLINIVFDLQNDSKGKKHLPLGRVLQLDLI